MHQLGARKLGFRPDEAAHLFAGIDQTANDRSTQLTRSAGDQDHTETQYLRRGARSR